LSRVWVGKGGALATNPTISSIRVLQITAVHTLWMGGGHFERGCGAIYFNVENFFFNPGFFQINANIITYCRYLS